MTGLFKITIVGGARGTITYPWMENMILDQGFRMLLTDAGEGPGRHCLYGLAVGSSSAPVDSADIGVINPITLNFTGSALVNGWDNTGEFGWTRRVFTSPRGAAAGNVSEISAGFSNNKYTKGFTRALILDTSGNPTTITVLADEVLIVTYEIRRRWISADQHTISYNDDGEPAETVVSYTQISDFSKNSAGLGAGGVFPWGGALVSDFTATNVAFYNESTGNPQIGSIGGGPSGTVMPAGDIATFNPPIFKNNEFTVSIIRSLSLSRM